jgi:hypothetical protein
VSATDFLIRWRVRIGVAAAVGLALIVFYIKITPTIEVVEAPPGTPFGFAFAVRNGWLPMNDVLFSCTLRNLNMRMMTPGVRLSSPDATFNDQRRQRLAEGSRTSFFCPANAVGPFVEGTAVLRLDYDMLAVPRVLEETYSWLGAVGRPRWVQGSLHRHGS